jgi:hypothetical protein
MQLNNELSAAVVTQPFKNKYLLNSTINHALYISLWFSLLQKIPERNNLQEERIIPAHGFRVFRAWLARCIVLHLR